ncbi:unnamed protein product [Schistocephalus solidus]|uniref:UBX domain-containing protein n=1 Tax=Schistocephalus solidus TaxID=70667 RepID=A0A183TNW4_SCHSO|nr:unnamed protein product [Schistocephalus solidus]
MAENDCESVAVTSTTKDDIENSSPQHPSSLPPQSSSPTAASSLSGSAHGTVSLEERVKRLREAEQSKAEQRRIQFLESQRQAELKREKQKEERKRRIEETRQREEARTRMAQERRKELERQHQVAPDVVLLLCIPLREKQSTLDHKSVYREFDLRLNAKEAEVHRNRFTPEPTFSLLFGGKLMAIDCFFFCRGFPVSDSLWEVDGQPGNCYRS